MYERKHKHIAPPLHSKDPQGSMNEQVASYYLVLTHLNYSH